MLLCCVTCRSTPECGGKILTDRTKYASSPIWQLRSNVSVTGGDGFTAIKGVVGEGEGVDEDEDDGDGDDAVSAAMRCDAVVVELVFGIP